MNEKALEPLVGEILGSLGQTIEDLKSCLFSGNKRLMNEAKKTFASSLRSSLPLFEEAMRRTDKSPLDNRLLALLPSLQRLGIAVEDVIAGVQAAVETGVCFTDRALGEISEIMALLADLARDTNDVLATKNVRFRAYAVSSALRIRERSVESTLEHEKRLISGTCSPRASFVYLHVMDALKRVAQELGSLCEQA
jgi:Na+/phosphate symporter